MSFLIKNRKNQMIPVIIDVDGQSVQYNLMPFGPGSSVKSESITPNMETLKDRKFISITEIKG